MPKPTLEDQGKKLKNFGGLRISKGVTSILQKRTSDDGDKRKAKA
jgi:hypothetical protein